jgi:hypothetical protein
LDAWITWGRSRAKGVSCRDTSLRPERLSTKHCDYRFFW